MPASTPNSISRYRPAILVLAGAAAAYASYHIYTITTSQSSPNDSLRRSNAVRRPNARQRLQALHTARLSDIYGDPTAFGDVGCHGVRIPLNPHHLISRSDLRDVITQQLPQATPEQIDTDIELVYDTFLDRLLALVAPHRAPSDMETDAIATWVAARHSDRILRPAIEVERARARYLLMLHNTAPPMVDGAESVAATDLSWGSDEDTEGDIVDATDGQTLQRTLYHIAEERARQEGVIHRGVTCNGCDEKPIRGIRWRCANCADFDLCSHCEATSSHIKTHIFYKVRVPAPYLGITKQEPLYPGKPHMMSSSVQSTLKKRLIAETKMEAEEIDALWEQFTCLAGTEWLADPNNIGWALDRRAFNHAFIPHFNSFVSAPNLVYDRVFAYYDSDKNGLIGFEEWIRGINGMHTTDDKVKSRIVFDGYDIDGDGFISRKDVLRIFRAFYAIEKEATGNYVAEMTEELSVRNALDTINSGQPLGSAFTPRSAANEGRNARLLRKGSDDFANTEPVLQEDNPDIAERSEMLMTADIHNVTHDLPQAEQDRILTDRWARRQFYIDEEEGLDRPGHLEDDAEREHDDFTQTGVSNEDPEEASDQPNTRPRWSRSSSRVRFQDDVDIETRSNASTSSRPIGERWGGYEIPEPEKDLGRDVLYQITQQGFNELLDPIFADKENDAMDAHATRSERRKLAAQLEKLVDHLRTQEARHLRAICMIGIFRWSKCIVEMFRVALNTSSTHSKFEDFAAIFRGDNGVSVGQKVAEMRLLRIYYAVQLSLLESIELPDDCNFDDMTLWNTWLCRNQLHNEVIGGAIALASGLGWISDTEPSDSSSPRSAHTAAPRRDPTMPQFRPNSLADVLAAESSTSSTDSGAIDMSSRALHREMSGFDHEEGQLRSRPGGPFFLCSTDEAMSTGFSDQDTVVQDDTGTSAQLTAPLSTDNVETSTQSQNPASEHPAAKSNVVNWQDYTDDPMLHVIYVDSSSGTEQVRVYMKDVVHSTSPFTTEINQRKPLYRHVRELAMDPKALSHEMLLASLETVQQEINERKGSGLINFEEFDSYFRFGRMGFLGSWMDWVSI